MDANQLYRAHRFEEAASVYKDKLSSKIGNEWANLDGLGDALVAAGRYLEAIPYLERVDRYMKGLIAGGAGKDIPISVCHWVLGDRERGLEVIKGLVVAVRDRVIIYTDPAGGVSQGIIMCYMAATLRRQDDVELALTFLTDRANKRRIEYWPGPAALLLLGRATLEESVQNATGAAELERAKHIAEVDPRRRKYLTIVLFAAAVQRRLAGDEAGCRAYMAECASLTNPLIEYEWHLAKNEIS